MTESRPKDTLNAKNSESGSFDRKANSEFKRNRLIKLLVLAIFFALTLLSAKYIQVLKSQDRLESTPSMQVSRTVLPTDHLNSTDKQKCAELKYTNKTNYKIGGNMVVNNTDKFQIKLSLGSDDLNKILNEDTYVDTFDFHPETQMVAYITGQRYPGNDYENTRKVILYNLKTDEKKTIYQKENEKRGVEFVDSLADVGFSKDGNLLAITTSESLMLYNVAENILTNSFTKERNDKGIGGIWGYYNPRFNNGNTKILLDLGFWEGKGVAIYHLVSNQLTTLPYTGYATGASVVNWYNGKLLLTKWGEPDSGSVNISSNFYLVTLPELTEEFLFRTGTDWTPSLLHNNLLYVLSETNESSNEWVCNNVGEAYKVTTKYQNLYKYDIPANQLTKLLTVDATESSGVPGEYKIGGFNIISINGKDRLLVNVEHNNISEIFDVDINNSNKLTKLILN
jgi:hypothetical protein